jgi:competence protein ComEC
LAADCVRAQVIVSTVPIRRECGGPSLTIDRFAILKGGAMTVTFTGDGARIETVADERGKRPWTLPGRGR